MELKFKAWVIDTQTAGYLPKSFFSGNAPEMIEWTDIALFDTRRDAEKQLKTVKDKFPLAKPERVEVCVP